MRRYNTAILGATGMVGRRFVSLLHDHPWFDVTVVAASKNSAGKSYREAVGGRWTLEGDIPARVADMTVQDATDVAAIAAQGVELVFMALELPSKDDQRALEEAYAKAEIVVISNTSANRKLPDVPMVVPEINPEHFEVIHAQRKRLGTTRGFISSKSNCSIQSYVPALHPLREFGIRDVLACTYQAISGAGKTFADWPEMVDNVIPYIGGEEEKSEQEPLKIWGTLADGVITLATSPAITTQCIRVPVSDGHLAAVFVRFDRKPTMNEILSRWENYRPESLTLGLPLSPQKFLHYFDDPTMPQTKLHRDLERGMAVSMGRLRPDTQYDYKFICLSHNTLRGAAGGGVLAAEYLAAKGYF